MARLLRAAVVLALSLWSLQAVAQSARVEMTVQPQRIVEGDQATVELVATGDYDTVQPPTSDGLDLTQTGRASQVNIMGSVVQRSERLTFAGTPRRKGRFIVKGAVLLRNGEVVAAATDSVIEVVDARASLGPAMAPDAAAGPSRYVGEPFFVRPLINIVSPYVGQPFVVGYDLYWSRNQNVSGLSGIGDPDYGDFAVEDLLAGKQTTQEVVRFAGEAYHHQLTRQVLLVATRSGRHELIGPRYRVDVSNFFNARAIKVGPPPIAIDVRPLPTEGRPDDFNAGAVGKLKLDGWLLERGQRTSTLKLTTGERSVIAYAIEGSGNLHGVSAPAPPVVDGMTVEALPGGASEDIHVGVNGPEGRRVWQFTIAFDRPGQFVVPAQSISVFDPFEETYQRSTAGPFTVDVEGEAIVAAVTAVAADGAAKPPPTRALRPIAPIADLGAKASVASNLPDWVGFASGLPWAIALLGLLGFLRKQKALGRQPAQQRLRALDTARARIEAGRALRDYSALRADVDAFLLLRLGLSGGGLTFAALADALAQRQAPPTAVAALIGELERCEQSRFAPSSDDGGYDTSADAVIAALTAIDAATPGSSAGRPAGGSGAASLLFVGAALWTALHPVVADAATLDEDFAAANAAYVAGKLDVARAGYEDLLSHGAASPAIHYNLGNVLVRQDRLGAALAHYRHALRLGADATLSDDIEANLALARERLAEASRRRHRILHIFDEAPELSVALARAAPRVVLGWLAFGLGWSALLAGLWWWRRRPRDGWLRAVAGGLALLQLAALGWRVSATAVLENARYGVVVATEAPLQACTGVSEPLDMPEGLEVRMLRERPDGRVEVRLPNGRIGCVDADALYNMPANE
jgi:tetratricopeptide (TPR) repeat protein